MASMTLDLLETEPDKDVWREWRRRGLGGSDAAAVVDASPFESRWGLWAKKTGRMPDSIAESAAMRWGTLLEGAVTDEFERELGVPIRHRQARAERLDMPWWRCTVDGIAEFDRGPELVEIKTTNVFSGPEAWADGMPVHVQLQCLHNMIALDLPRARVAVLIGGSDFRTYILERAPDVEAYLHDKEREFWLDHVLGDVPPAEIDGSDATAEALKAVFRVSDGTRIQLSDHARELLYERERAAGEEKAAAARKAAAENELKAILGEAEVGLWDGRPLVTWKGVESHRLDTAALKAAHPDIYEQFCKPALTRRFEIKGLPR